ncbi:MAG: hypothetical protein HY558_00770 [Euryarchaeota archaeon]|nr:hypothetical protein [Euryarchaeota archaeon]
MAAKESIPPEAERLESLAGEWAAALGPNLVSILLYGGSASGEAGRGPLKVLVVVKHLDPSLLDALAPRVARWQKRRVPAPLLLTLEEVHDGADVFPLDLLDMAQSHRVLRGSNPFEGLQVKPQDVRLRLEYEVRSRLIRLRQVYLENLRRPRALARVLQTSAAALAPIARGLLHLKGLPGPPGRRQLFEAAAREYSLPMDGFERALSLRGGRLPKGEAPGAARDLLALLERIEDLVDELKV